jgi:hypothetical protein
MRRHWPWLGAGVALAISLAAVTEGFGATATTRFSLGVTLVVDGVSGSGGAVWEATLKTKGLAVPELDRVATEVRGQAIPISLDSGMTIFVLRRSRFNTTSAAAGDFIRACLPVYRGAGDLVEKMSHFEGGCTTTLQRPMIVYLTDPSDARTITEIPYIEDLKGQPSDGPVIESIAIDLQVTDEPLTSGIARQYPWIDRIPRLEDGGIISLDEFYRDDFTRGVEE